MNSRILNKLNNISDSNKNSLALLLLFIVSCIFLFNNNISLWDQDESAYALFAKNMLETGNWLIPDGMWSEIHRKPPLHFWTIAFSYKIFGVNEFAVRFPTAVFTILNYLLILFVGPKLFGKRVSFAATIILATSVLIPIIGKIAFVDATLNFFSTLCAFSILLVLNGESKKWVITFWISFACAVLTKGPPVVIFTFIFGFLLFMFHPNRKNLIAFHPWFYLPLAMIPFIIYCYATTKLDGGTFLKWMYDWYIAKRIGGSVLGQSAAPGMHLIFILLCFFAFTAIIPSVVQKAVKQFRTDFKFTMPLIIWFISGWLIYEFSPSKLPTYVLNAHLPLALLIAIQLLQNKKPSNTSLIIHFIFQIGIASIFMLCLKYFQFPPSSIPYFYLISVILLIGSGLSFWLIKSNYVVLGYLIPAIIFQICLHFIVFPVANTFKNCPQKIGDYIAQMEEKPNAVLIANSKFTPPGLPFYLSQSTKEIKEEHRFSVLVYELYRDQNAKAIILNGKHFNSLQSIDPDLNFGHFTNQDFYPEFKNDYYIFKGVHYKPIEKLVVQAPIPPKSLKENIQAVLTSPEWMKDIESKAKQYGISKDQMVLKDAKWLCDNQSMIYQFDTLMRRQKNWLALMKVKSGKENLSLESACLKYAELVTKTADEY